MKIRFNIATNQLQVLGRQEQGYLKMQENPSERNMCGTEETPVSNKMTNHISVHHFVNRESSHLQLWCNIKAQTISRRIPGARDQSQSASIFKRV